MCGITGFIDHNKSASKADLERASATIKHRGGNGNGFIFDQKEHYTLGMANERLATIDLTQQSQQPLTSHCGNYCITFNGTIYNYIELRETLIKYGVIFSTLTDTEVILESYKKWGTKSFGKLDGSFAFALLDRKLNQLIMVRDEIGAKPLYYYQNSGFYAFASEIRALLAYPDVKKEINKDQILSFFRYGYFVGDQTIYQQIYKHDKGTIKIIDLYSGNSYEEPIYRIPDITEVDDTDDEQKILVKIEELLTESILKRNLADVPVGTLLSGGYDSATVAAILQKNQSKRIKTFTVGFTDEKLDEAPQAKKIAAYLKTSHEEFYLNKAEAFTLVEQLPEVFDEPLGDSSAIPLLFIAGKVNKEVKVLLGAEGGDELFGGYRTYAKAIQLNKLEQRKMPTFLKSILSGLIGGTQPQMKEVLAAEGLLNKYLEVNACFTMEEVGRLINHEIQTPHLKKGIATDIKGLLIYDLNNYLPQNLLFRSDRCFMHHGVDNRDALLKNELIDYLNMLNPKWFLKDGQQKYLLTKITGKYIPANLMTRPIKGFVTPLASWLKTTLNPLVEKYLSPPHLKAHQLLNTDEVLIIKNSFYANSTTYNAQKVWLLLQFQMWYYHWMEQE